MIEAILFDLDGLMVDSEPHSIASWQAVLAKRGVQFDQAALDSVLGQRVIETAQTAIRLFHLPDQPEDLAQEKAEYQIAHLDGNVTAMPGLIELLDFVDHSGLKKAVASSGLRHYIDAVLTATHVRDRFSVIISADDVVNGKPAPDVFLAAARALDIAAEKLSRAGGCALWRASRQSRRHDVFRRAERALQRARSVVGRSGCAVTV